MASLCREFQVPSVLDAKDALQLLPPGAEVTVDGHSGRIYLGRVEELLVRHIQREPFMKDSPVYQTLRRVADLIVPLHLLDPKATTFAPAYCETLHDIMRYVHEKCYTEMFQISDLVSDAGGGSLKLQAPIPLTSMSSTWVKALPAWVTMRAKSLPNTSPPSRLALFSRACSTRTCS